MRVKRLALHGLVAVFTSFTTSDAIILDALDDDKEHVASNTSVGLGQDDHQSLARLIGGHKAPLTTAALVPAAAGGRPATADSLTFQASTLAPWPWYYYLPFILSLTWMHGYVYLRDRPSLVVAGVYVLYIGLHTIASSMQVLVGMSPTNTNRIASAQAVVFMSLVLKLAISAVQVLVEIRKEELPAGHLLENLKDSFRCSMLPSAFYTTSDVLLVYCQQSMGMTEMQILQKIGIPITAFVWWRIFRVTIGLRKILGLVIIMSGTILYAYGQSSSSQSQTSADVSGKSGSGATLNMAVWFHRSILLLQVLCGTCGGVSNEYFLLRCSASVSMQNCAMYAQGLLLVMVSSLCFGNGIPARYALEFSGIQWGCVLALALTGICTSHFLRHLGSIWKQVAFGAMLVMFFTVDNVVFGKTYANLAVGGVVIVLCGNCLAVLDGVQDSRTLLAPAKPGASNSTDDLKDNAASVEGSNKKPLAPLDDSPPLAAASSK